MVGMGVNSDMGEGPGEVESAAEEAAEGPFDEDPARDLTAENMAAQMMTRVTLPTSETTGPQRGGNTGSSLR